MLDSCLIAATRFEWAQVLAAVFAASAAVLVPLTGYIRRPAVELREDPQRVYSRLEGTARDSPFVRLLVRASRARRAAHGIPVEVVSRRRLGDSEDQPFGNWPLRWTSATDADVTVYANAERSVDFGRLVRIGPARVAKWHLWLTLWSSQTGGVGPADERDILEPGEWIIRLLVGCDDGDARYYDVRVAWKGDEADARTALAAVLERIAVQQV